MSPDEKGIGNVIGVFSSLLGTLVSLLLNTFALPFRFVFALFTFEN